MEDNVVTIPVAEYRELLVSSTRNECVLTHYISENLALKKRIEELEKERNHE